MKDHPQPASGDALPSSSRQGDLKAASEPDTETRFLASRDDSSRRKRSSGVVVPHRARWTQRLAARLIYTLIRSVAATLRFRLNDRSGMFVDVPTETVIFAIWHNRLSLCLMLYRNYMQKNQPTRHLAAMVSASRDGGLLARILELFGVEPVRGSTSRRGPQALRELVTWCERGYDLAITPDGPRGPCYVVQEGVMALAQLTGLPIVSVSYHLNWKIRLKSWDRFQVPLPFSRCDIHIGEVVRVPREATDAEREALRQKLEQSMKAITQD